MKNIFDVIVSTFIGLSLFFSHSINAQGELNLAERKFDLGFYNEVIQTLELLSEKGELPTEGYLLLGRSYLNINEPYRAELFLSLGNSRVQSNALPDFSYFLAKAFMMQGNYDCAHEYFLTYSTFDSNLGRHYAQNAQIASGIIETEPIVRVYNMPWNTDGAESNLAVFNDDLFFISRSIIDEANCGYWDCKADGQLIATVNGDPFSIEGQLGFEFGNGNENAVIQISYSSDGKRVAIVMGKPGNPEYSVLSNKNGLSIYFADVGENGDWESVKPFEYNGIGFSNLSPFLVGNGETLYFASNRPGGLGGFDLYVSRFIDGQWLKPENLGPEINSPGNEISPFVMGDHLFFSSDWHPGLGGLDVFFTSLSDPRVIHNAGRSINSTRDDYNFTLDAQFQNGYLVSNRPGGRGLDDIYGFSSEKKLFNLSSPSILAEHTDVKRKSDPQKSNLMITEFLNRSNAVFASDMKSLDVALVEDMMQLDVFSVQIASFKNDFDEQRFVKQLGDIGDVFKVFYHTDIKVRVGTYYERDEAEAAAVLIRSRGYPDAFVVKEQIIVSSSPVVSSENVDQVAPINKQEFQSKVRYLVRLGAFRNTSQVDEKMIGRDLIKESSGEFTVLLLGYFDNISEAESARENMIGKGFPDAYLIIENNGERVRYRP